MEAEGESSQQLWSPPTTLLIHVRRRHGRTSPILNPEALILAIPILVLLIFFLVLPLIFSYANHQILKPSLVQKVWDSINIFLVLIAVLCGVFAKRNDDNSSSLDAGGEKNLDSVMDVSDDNIRKSIASSEWLDFPDKSEYDKMTSSRSYPDLRQESLWGCESNRFKCFDDFELNFHRQPEKLYHRERRSQKVETDAAAEPAPPVRRRRSVHRGRNDEKNENKSPPPPVAQSLPPLPPPEPEFIPPVAEKAESIQKEKGGATKEIATAIASLQYGTQTQRKKKVKPRDIYESATEDSLPPSAPAPSSPPPPSKGLQSLLKKSSKSKHVHSVSTTAQPPPPPPPPPNSIFANIFKTGSKSMRSQLSSASSQPPPPPPPPPYSILNNIFSSGSKSKRCQIPSASSHPFPPPPTSSTLIPSFENLIRSRRFKNSDTATPALPPPPPPPGICPLYTGKPPKPNTSSHNETAIIVPPSPPPPPPPPPPPFRTPEVNFVPKRDLARNRSTRSSQRNSPEVKNVHVNTIGSDSGHSISPSVSCPSPDVNTKADTFISRLRDGWRLEKLNSINERQNSVSSTSNRL
ncbi:uncharacterized protein [Primulina eburnea]|uniref:uncharacterized protein n=1 Tax=Primulina eburnea TaxID=1245227 RepID=UPI003C6C3DA2